MARLNRKRSQASADETHADQHSRAARDDETACTVSKWRLSTSTSPRLVNPPTICIDGEERPRVRHETPDVCSDQDSVCSINEDPSGSLPSDSDGASDGDSDLSDFNVDDSASEAELRRGARGITRRFLQTPRRLVRRSPAKTSSIFVLEDSEDEVRVVRPDVDTGAGYDQIVHPEHGDSDKENLSPVHLLQRKTGVQAGEPRRTHGIALCLGQLLVRPNPSASHKNPTEQTRKPTGGLQSDL